MRENEKDKRRNGLHGVSSTDWDSRGDGSGNDQPGSRSHLGSDGRDDPAGIDDGYETTTSYAIQ